MHRACARAGSRAYARDTALDVLRIESERLVDLGENGHGAGRETAFGVAFHVYAGTITSSPGRTPAPIRAQMSADEPALTMSACFEPMCAGELALEVDDFVRPVADAVVAEELRLRITLAAASTSSSPYSMPPGNIGGSGRLRAGGPPSRASWVESPVVVIATLIMDIAPCPRNRAPADQTSER